MDHHSTRLQEPTESRLLEPLWQLASEVLKDPSYQAMRLHYAEEISIREIAKIMGKTETGIKVILFRARQKLQSKAKDRGISL